MEKNEHSEDFTGLKARFSHFYQHRKKVAALRNRAYTVKFEREHRDSLNAIESFLKKDFLVEEEEVFLNFLLRKYETNYLEWAYRTKWLKEQMGIKKKVARPIPIQMLIDFDKKQKAPLYPAALIAMQQAQPGAGSRVLSHLV